MVVHTSWLKTVTLESGLRVAAKAFVWPFRAMVLVLRAISFNMVANIGDCSAWKLSRGSLSLMLRLSVSEPALASRLLRISALARLAVFRFALEAVAVVHRHLLPTMNACVLHW